METTRSAGVALKPFGTAALMTIETGQPVRIQPEPARMAHERHKRKYAEAELEGARVSIFAVRGTG